MERLCNTRIHQVEDTSTTFILDNNNQPLIIPVEEFSQKVIQLKKDLNENESIWQKVLC